MNKTKLDHIKVALYCGNMAKENDKQWHTDSHSLASGVAEIQTRMTLASTPEEVDATIDGIIRGAAKTEYLPMSNNLWVFICLNVNWLSWAWAEQGEEELSNAWSDAWHRINKYSIDTLKGDDLIKYLKEVD